MTNALALTLVTPNSYCKKKTPLQDMLAKVFKVWAHQDLNLGPPDYESGALTN